MGSKGHKKIEDMIDYDIKGPKSKSKLSGPTISKTWKIDWDSKIGNIFRKIFKRRQ